MAAQLPGKYAYGTGDVPLAGDLINPADRQGIYGGEGTDSAIQDVLNSLYLGNPDVYGEPRGRGGERQAPDLFEYPRPSGYPDEYPEGQRADIMRRTGSDPQEFIRQQLAGDVVPLPYGARRSAEERLNSAIIQSPGTVGHRGIETIRGFGGPGNPYLDLLDVLQFPSGRPIGR